VCEWLQMVKLREPVRKRRPERKRIPCFHFAIHASSSPPGNSLPPEGWEITEGSVCEAAEKQVKIRSDPIRSSAVSPCRAERERRKEK
jgi:hypothetical protein